MGQDDGTGIGLYLAREIVLMEDGYIKVQSEPGRGSKFSIYLKNHKYILLDKLLYIRIIKFTVQQLIWIIL